MIKVKIDDLTVGMVVSEHIYDPSTKKLLLKCSSKLDKEIINQLKEHGITEVPIEEQFTLSMNPIDMVGSQMKKMLLDEIARLVPNKPEANPSNKIVVVEKLVTNLINNNKLHQQKDLLEFCLQMKICSNEFLFKHCVATAALSLLVAGSLDLPSDEILTIGQAALIHDVGICEMSFIAETIKRNKQEEALWQEHPKYGYYLIKDKNIDRRVATFVLYHHEHWNGAGFPSKISGEDIPLGSRIIAVCETYDRLLRFEKYPHYQAVEYLYGAGNYIFDSKVVNAFVNNLAVYPLGSLVKLSTGEVGLVVNVRKNQGPRPIVKVYFDSSNKPLLSPKDVDLGKERTIFIQKVL